uniref:Uncharacterized protein n=1 Tax=Molossus molossus TaxID=27622 RepID=A0A7J8ERT5_MOLMO|nr:hypothetical protein HJG59_008762 [Molossus molossus]
MFTWQIRAEDEQLHETEDCPLTLNHRAVTLSLCLRFSLPTVFCDRFLALVGELCRTRHLRTPRGHSQIPAVRMNEASAILGCTHEVPEPPAHFKACDGTYYGSTRVKDIERESPASQTQASILRTAEPGGAEESSFLFVTIRTNYRIQGLKNGQKIFISENWHTKGRGDKGREGKSEHGLELMPA